MTNWLLVVFLVFTPREGTPHFYHETPGRVVVEMTKEDCHKSVEVLRGVDGLHVWCLQKSGRGQIR